MNCIDESIPDEPCPYVPSTPVVYEALEQAATELDRQKRDGWHLIPKVVDGKLVRCLETGS